MSKKEMIAILNQNKIKSILLYHLEIHESKLDKILGYLKKQDIIITENKKNIEDLHKYILQMNLSNNQSSQISRTDFNKVVKEFIAESKDENNQSIQNFTNEDDDKDERYDLDILTGSIQQG